METLSYQNTTIYLNGSLDNLNSLIPKDASSVVLIVDAQVFNHPNYDFSAWTCIQVDAAEENKTLQTVEKLGAQMLELGLDRQSFVVGVGGGVTCDLVGFAASIFLRGLRFGFVPTTLLAQVDAAIGGKNGVNFGSFKNILGVINQPDFLLIDANFLKTLPHEELKSGLAEVVKHACISSKSYFDFIKQNVNEILKLNPVVLNEVLKESIRIKTELVTLDTRESGPRKLLNYGHTFGHAIEVKYGLLHGEAVSLGMLIINEIAVQEGLLSPGVASEIGAVLSKIGLPTEFANYLDSSLLTYVAKDKKRTIAHIDLVFVTELGKAQILPFGLEKIRNSLNLILEKSGR